MFSAPFGRLEPESGPARLGSARIREQPAPEHISPNSWPFIAPNSERGSATDGEIPLMFKRMKKDRDQRGQKTTTKEHKHNNYLSAHIRVNCCAKEKLKYKIIAKFRRSLKCSFL